ncbi:hypothetical protein DM02DRAFT_700291 [Periconia macrospinosa]|uniref:CENP-V/GFA domain-containing protein n=1 Tax=Periconia macrospinosa TaxID=97972 RepID=A0A2V1D2R6_9PLEO|nr:hypothetical protein DM02DRAFT_700291 [Periconia macrospinosa]
MSSGSCYCGQAKVFFESQPMRQGLCHCGECKKYTGSAYSVNVIVSEKGWKTEGALKTISKTARSGNTISTIICPECGTSMYREGATFPGQKALQAGILDDMDLLNNLKMEVELFAPQRVSWVPKLAGTEDKHGMN